MKCPICKEVEMQDPGISMSGLVCSKCGHFEACSSLVAINTADDRAWHNPQYEAKYIDRVGVVYNKRDESYYMTSKLKMFSELLRNKAGIYTKSEAIFCKIDDLFKKLSFGEFKLTKYEKRVKVLVAITQIVLRIDGTDVLLVDLCQRFGVPPKGSVKIFFRVSKLLESELGSEARKYHDTIQQLVEHMPTMRNKPELWRMVPKVVDLFDAISFDMSRDRLYVASHIAYLVWVSQIKTRKRITLSAFLKENKIKLYRTDIKSLYQRLEVLMKSLPWLSADERVTFSNFHLHLDSCIRNPNATLALLPDCDVTLDDVTGRKRVKPAAEDEKSRKRKRFGDVTGDGEVSETTSTAVVLRVAPPDSQLLNDDDLNGTDIGELLRSDEEAERYGRLRAELC